MDSSTPNRMTTRGIVRNYAELGGESSRNNSTEVDNNDGVFRVPTTPFRGRKRKVPLDGLGEGGEIPKRGRPRGGISTRGGRGGARRSGGKLTEDGGLLGAVKHGGDFKKVVEEWINNYEANPDDALTELLQFFLSSSGCRGKLTGDMLLKLEYSEIVRHMTEEFDEESGDYPMVMTGAQWKRFRGNFSQMIMTLVAECKHSIIFNNQMMDSVIQLLTTLADSQVRAFRHTATFAAMTLSSALVDVTLELVENKAKNERQIEAEQAKLKAMGGSGNNDKLDVLIARKTELKEHAQDVSDMLQYIFKSVFVHRYRDCLPDIRSICINELGKWMIVYPEHFLDDSYLKYIGWSLHDKMPEVRFKCLEALLPLYNRQEIVGKLELFSNKFKERLVSMVMDKHLDTAVKACELMSAIYRAFPTLLTKDDCVPIYELVYTNYRPLAVAAGEFLNVKVFPNAAPAGSDPKTSQNKELLLDLIRFFIEGECHEHGAYLVDALIDSNEIVKDWGSYIELLKNDEAAQCDAQIIEIMCCSIKQAATGDHPVGRAMAKRGPQAANSREARQLADERTKISEVFIPQLPLLLQTYIADREKVCNLVVLPLYFQLEMYVAGQLTQHAAELMKALENVVERHPDRDVLAQVAEVINHLSSYSGTAQVTETARIKLVDGVALQVGLQVDRLEKDEVIDEDDEAAMKSAFRKLVGFASHIDTGKKDVFDRCIQVTTWEEGRAPSEVVQLCVQYMCLVLNWDLQRIIHDIEPNRNDALKKLSKRVANFFTCCEQIMMEHVSGLETTYLAMCDALLIFNEHLAERNDNWKGLVFKMDQKLLRRLKTYVVDNVFSQASTQFDQQEQLEMMMKRRRLLANYGKLVIYGVLPIGEAAEIFEQYVKYYQDFGDIMKMIISKCRDAEMLSTASAVGKALQMAYERLRSTSKTPHVDPLSEDFAQLHELARRLSSIFGNDHLRNRESIAKIHRDGIIFALEISGGRASKNPTNVSFLEVIQEFSQKLLRQDKECIRRYLEKHALAMGRIPTESPLWSSYALYKDSLKERNPDDVSSVRSFSTSIASSKAPSVTPTKRGRSSRNRMEE
ncbi:unnamed protein product, partial [Mesorhabditis belari]|uniref:SCD domain-containing protein n=1 Tax=Mesorhabditis belari TaxID=2138241 RepID=A0AAF3EF11_9BILA